MAMAKRIFLLILVNILVITTITIVLNILGIQPYLTASGIDYGSLMAFCLIFGMGGAFISLLLSKQMAKWMMGVEIITPDTRDSSLRELVNTVHTLSRGAGLPKMPEVGVYRSEEVNAFATGPSRGNALVAISTGLLQRMNKAELEGVVGHEISHIANGDMVTMTMIQGIVNAFVMFLARVFAFAISQFLRRDDDDGPSPMINFLLVMVLQILFSILGSVVVAYFSRIREYRADKGSAKVAGRDKMIEALQALQRSSQLIDTRQEALMSLKISGKSGGLAALLATHPPLAERIKRLQEYR